MIVYNKYSKQNPIRSKRYKEYIASVPCLVSGGKANVHHENFGASGHATKASDLWCLPLSAEWHTANQKSRHRHPGGWRAFYSDFGIDPYLECLKLINYFFSNGGKL